MSTTTFPSPLASQFLSHLPSCRVFTENNPPAGKFPGGLRKNKTPAEQTRIKPFTKCPRANSGRTYAKKRPRRRTPRATFRNHSVVTLCNFHFRFHRRHYTVENSYKAANKARYFAKGLRKAALYRKKLAKKHKANPPDENIARQARKTIKIFYALKESLYVLPNLKTGALLAAICTFSPVAGFRPVCAGFSFSS